MCPSTSLSVLPRQGMSLEKIVALHRWMYRGGRPSALAKIFKENLALAIIAGLAMLKLLIHVLTSSNYGYFRDEFYYIAASQHLALGYVDFPPFIALLTALVRFTLGDSLLALHFFPALAGAGLIVVTGLMARQLGADPFGQVLAALAMLVAPVYLG